MLEKGGIVRAFRLSWELAGVMMGLLRGETVGKGQISHPGMFIRLIYRGTLRSTEIGKYTHILRNKKSDQ